MRGVTTTTWVLRVLVALGPVVALLAGVPQGYAPSPFMVVVVDVLLYTCKFGKYYST